MPATAGDNSCESTSAGEHASVAWFSRADCLSLTESSGVVSPLKCRFASVRGVTCAPSSVAACSASVVVRFSGAGTLFCGGVDGGVHRVSSLVRTAATLLLSEPCCSGAALAGCSAFIASQCRRNAARVTVGSSYSTAKFSVIN